MRFAFCILKLTTEGRNMLDINFIRQNRELVKQGAKNKGVKVDIEKLLRVDDERKRLLQEVENLRSQINKTSQSKPTQAEIEKLKIIKEKIKNIEPSLEAIAKEFDSLMRQVPNPPAKDAPVGKNENDNQVLRKWGKPTKFDFVVRNHIELGKINDVIDTIRATKVSGARFYYLKGLAVEIEMALIRFAIRWLKEKGFTPIIPPHLISEKAMSGMGYLDHGGDQEIYHLTKDNLYLIGTSEQPIGAMHTNEIIDEKKLPLKYVGFSPCYRREAGSYGKDTAGILRSHQFDKIEMFVFCAPEESEKEHQKLLGIEEEIMRELELPYQVVNICAGDLGDPVVKKYDIEAWIPSQQKYRETHSTSNTTDYQARRLNIRIRRKNGKIEILHMLNGTAIAIGRTLIAIMENYQTKDGKIKIPEALKKYL
ncbi:MAG: seryl-tRNA synthetase [Candidatus Berkelbacteria bacterium Licking1014_7]|uniref:Serine--tRNA ligase n=1 Tax=Candidatus Berkelbacteria bacterium Licking1014_7 TaxID=2017147 RepID=A0A554LHN0_9BACT|nr:MAG: seryl-tRNA synthetase [Candidatus Berkelbacteria bacterium Licking1014_7]